MAELKTKQTEVSVAEFLEKVEDPARRAECFRLLEIMTKASGHPPKMWGDSIIGFGLYTYHYASGRSGEWMISGFSPRKSNLTVYVSSYLENFADILSRLGKFKTGKGCVYIKKLADVDEGVLAELVRASHSKAANAQQPAGT